MPDPTDDRLRALARAARTEVEAGLDTDTELAAVRERASTFAPEQPSTSGLRGAPRNRRLVVLGTAAAAVLIVGVAIWIGSTDDTITTTAATTLPLSLPATTAPIPATTPPTDPPSTTTTSTSTSTTTTPAAPDAVIPPGSIDLGPDDLIARAADGDVWWYPGALGEATTERILLIDRDDPRQIPEEGEGPNIIDHVAGTFDGSLIYSDCCEPVSGNVFAITEPGAEADLWSSPSGTSDRATRPFSAYEPRFEPMGTRMVASNFDVVQVTDLATGASDFMPLFDAGELGGLGAVWAGDSIAVLGWSFDEGLVLSVRAADTLASEFDRVVLEPPAEQVPFAGVVGATERSVVVFVRDDAGLARFITIETGSWTIVDDPLGFDVPADASEMHLGADGNLMAWVVDDVGWAQRRGAAPVQIDDGLAEIWIPEIRGSAVRPTEDPAPGSTGEPGALLDWRELRWETTRIGHSCVSDSTICTRVIHGPDGTPISLDPDSRVLTRHGQPEVSVTLPDAYGQLPWLYVAGPDDVVYLQVDPAVPAEVAADLVAVSLADGDAGRELGRWSDVVNNVGDSELVATPSGLVNVDCCGPEPLRPAPDALVLVPWVDRSGAEIASTDPSIGTSVYPDLTVTRSDRVPAGSRSWTIAAPADWANRGMPQVTPTFDGGFVAALPTGVFSTIVLRGWPDGEVEQIRLALAEGQFTVSVDRNGRVLVGDGDRFARVDPFADRTVRPSGQASIDVEAGTVTLPDLSAVTAEWVLDPVAFADAVSGAPAVNEQRTIAAEQRSDTEWLVTVTTSNFFDDSVFADRWELTLERADDGRLSFVSGQWSNACQPNRGHQDFQPALCV